MKKVLITLVLLLSVFINSGFSQCIDGTDEPSGCFFRCNLINGEDLSFSTDGTSTAPYCSSDRLTRWLKIKASLEDILINMIAFNCSGNDQISVQVFDSNFSPVSACQSYDANDFSTLLQVNSVVVGNDYFIRIESTTPIGCDFRLRIVGNEVYPVPILKTEGDSLIVKGTVSFDNPYNYHSLRWFSSNSNLSIVTGQGTNQIEFTKPRFEAINLQLQYGDSCSQLRSVNIALPAESRSCILGDDFPGCAFECRRFWGLEENFFSNSANNDFHKWFMVEMAEPVLRVSGEEFNCAPSTEIKLIAFNESQDQISNEVVFNSSNFQSQELVVNNLSAGDEISIYMEVPSEVGCDFSLLFDGTTAGSSNITADIRFISSQNNNSVDRASVSPINGTFYYDWKISNPNVSIVSGQGTVGIEISNPDNLPFDVCVTPLLSCQIGEENCETAMIDPLSTIPPCLPFGAPNAGLPGANPPGCLICLSVVTHSNGNYPPGQPISCGIPHNSTYQSIISDSSGILEGVYLSSNCLIGDGLQLIIFDGTTGQEVGCFGNLGTRDFRVEDLTPGNLYLLMIDGFNGDVCEYTIVVTGGANEGPPDAPGPITANPDTTLCPKATACYSIDPVANATSYEWKIPNNTSIISGGGINDTEVCIEIIQPGGGVISVTPSNSCFPGVPAIIPIVAVPIIPTFWPPRFICQSDLPWNTTVCGQNFSTDSLGGFEIVCQTSLGCDSIIKITLLPKVQIPSIIDTTICAGGCFLYDGVCYEEGGYDLTLSNASQLNGCDSLITLIVREGGLSNISSDFSLPQSACAGEPFTVEYSGVVNPNISFDWDFGNAQVISGTGAGPYQLVFQTENEFTISLVVSENGCASAPTSKIIQVLEPLLPLSLTCNASVDEVRFNWVADQSVANYSFNVTTGQSGFQDGNSYVVSNLSPNEIVTLEVIANSANGCAPVTDQQTCQAQDCPIVDVIIEPIPDICLNAGQNIFQLNGSAGNNTGALVWSGSGVSSSGVFDASQAGIGNHTIILEYSEGSCSWSATTQVRVAESPRIPVVSCTPSQTSIDFSWGAVQGAVDYRVNVLTGQSGVLNGTTFNVSALSPGEFVSIEVIVIGAPPCANVSTQFACTAEDCPPVSITINPINDICLESNTPTIILGSSGGINGTYIWSGPGVSPDGTFDPSVAGVGTQTISLEVTEGSCTYRGTTTVNIFQQPTADFSIDGQGCQGVLQTINYLGNASSIANYNWNFGNGGIVSGSNSGPYEVQFNSPGTETISLSVEENGCASTIVSKNIQVDEQLDPIIIRCQSPSSNEIIFDWNDDSKVQDYQVRVIDPVGLTGITTRNSFAVDGLNRGDEVEIELTAISNLSCPDVIETLVCISVQCPPINITIEPISTTFCEGDSTTYQLIPQLFGNTTQGTMTWSGTNISSDGIFNSAGLSAGNYNVEFYYEELGCQYSTTTSITVQSNPQITANVTSPIWKLNEVGKIDLMVSGGNPPYDVTYLGNTLTIDSLLPPGEYCFEVEDDNNCSDSECFQINEGIYTIKPVHIICKDEKAPLFISPRTGATFDWSPSFGLSCSTCPSPIASPGKSSIYQVKATLPSGQSATQNVSVIVLPSIICNLIPKQELIDFEQKLINSDSQYFEESDLEELEEQITNQLLKKEVNIVPNPTSGWVQVISNIKVEKVEVFDFAGKRVHQSNNASMDLSHLSKGIYFMKIDIGEEAILKRIVLL